MPANGFLEKTLSRNWWRNRNNCLKREKTDEFISDLSPPALEERCVREHSLCRKSCQCRVARAPSFTTYVIVMQEVVRIEDSICTLVGNIVDSVLETLQISRVERACEAG